MAAQSVQPELIEPGRDRIPFAMRESVRRRQPQCRDAGCRVLVTDGGDAETLSCGASHRLQVRLVNAGVSDRLTPHERSVAEQVG